MMKEKYNFTNMFKNTEKLEPLPIENDIAYLETFTHDNAPKQTKEIAKYALNIIHRLQTEKAEQKDEIERVTKRDNEKSKRSPFLMCENYDAYLESMSKTELIKYFNFVMGNYIHLVDKITRENIELQKQVDELEMEKARAMRGCEWLSDCQSQAVKDKAKEIFTKVKSILNYLDDEWEISNALYPLEQEYLNRKGIEVE